MDAPFAFRKLRRQAWLAVFAGLFFFIAPAAVAQSSDFQLCQSRIAEANRRLQDATRKHGPNNPDARNRQRELDDLRNRCALTGFGGNWTDHGYQVPTVRDPINLYDEEREQDRDCKDEKNDKHDSKHEQPSQTSHRDNNKNQAQTQQVTLSRSSDHSKHDSAHDSR